MWGQNADEDDDNSAMLTITGQWNIDAEARAPPRRSIHDNSKDSSGRFSFSDKNRSNSGRFSFTSKNRSSSGLGLGGGSGHGKSSSRFSFGEKNRTGSGLLDVGSGGGGKRSSSSSQSNSRFSFSEKNRGDSGTSADASRFTFTDKNRSFSNMLLTITGPTDDDEESSSKDGENEETPKLTWREWWEKFYWDNEVIILLSGCIVVARIYPPLGAIYLAPQITSTWIAVMLIFVASGMGIRTRDFTAAMVRMKFNLFIQTFSFCALSSIVYGVSRALVASGVLNSALGNGMVMVACLPATINSVAVLTKQAGGDEAAAIFNSAFANFLGIFVSPALILGYLSVEADVSMGEVFYKLALRVVVPVLLGQVLQRIRCVVRFVKRHRFWFHQSTLYGLVWIVYTVFCRTFSQERLSSLQDIFVMVAVELFLYMFLMCVAWFSLKVAFRDKPKLRVMGLFGCCLKTVAMGIPLIEAIYGNDPLIALYTLPLLVWYPIQIIVGSLAADRLKAFVRREFKRLGMEMEESDSDEDSFDFLPEEFMDDKDKEKKPKSAPPPAKKKKKKPSRARKEGSVKGDGKGSEDENATVHTNDSRTYEDREMGYDNRSVMDIGDSTVWTYEDDMTIAPDPCVNDHFCLEEGVVYERLRSPNAIACIPGSSCISCYRVIASDIHELGVIPTEAEPVFVCMKCRNFVFCNQCWKDNLTDIVAPSGFVSTFFQSLAEYY